MKQKALLINFKGLLLKQIKTTFLEGESSNLHLVVVVVVVCVFQFYLANGFSF